MKSVHLAPLILIPVSKSANSASNIPIYVHTMRACLSPRHTNLLTLACQISSGITTLPVVYTIRPWLRVISRMVARSASDFQRARDPLSRATCDINPASVSSLSQTECPRTWDTTRSILPSSILTAHLSHKCTCPILISLWHRRWSSHWNR